MPIHQRPRCGRSIQSLRPHWNYRRMFTPEDFHDNEAWIAIRLSSSPIRTERDGDLPCLALMDRPLASSCLGRLFRGRTGADSA